MGDQKWPGTGELTQQYRLRGGKPLSDQDIKTEYPEWHKKKKKANTESEVLCLRNSVATEALRGQASKINEGKAWGSRNSSYWWAISWTGQRSGT